MFLRSVARGEKSHDTAILKRILENVNVFCALFCCFRDNLCLTFKTVCLILKCNVNQTNKSSKSMFSKAEISNVLGEFCFMTYCFVAFMFCEMAVV